LDLKRLNKLDEVQKKEILDQELAIALQQNAEANENSMNLKEEKSSIQKNVDGDVKKIVEAKTELTTASDEVMNLEQCIYEYSIQNRNLMSEKEKIIELLPEMVKASQTGK